MFSKKACVVTWVAETGPSYWPVQSMADQSQALNLYFYSSIGQQDLTNVEHDSGTASEFGCMQSNVFQSFYLLKSKWWSQYPSEW